ncbi:MAG: carbohydrate-binding domain-containing protein [Clostridiales bacterium]|jgi:hypothetical protein|nr:carbohydrate-binding domain-containing protein [Clostridiales bacterium]
MKKERLLGILLSLALMLTMMPTVGLTTYAGSEDPAPNQTSVTYIDANGKEQTCNKYAEVTSSTTNWTEDWYVVKGTVEIAGGVSASSDVHLILCDGANLTVSNDSGNAISVNGDFTIYAQSTGQNMGVLSATTTDTWSGISVVNSNNDMTINGGTIIAKGKNYGIRSESSEVIINGGNVTAVGSSGIYAGKNITINRGIVNFAKADEAKNSKDICSGGGDITICGGSVNITGQNGICTTEETEKKHNIVISGGNVSTASNTEKSIYADGGDVTISGGNVDATCTGNGINARGNVTITDGKVSAKNNLKGIEAGNITVDGGEVTVTLANNSQYAIKANGTVTVSGGKLETAKGSRGIVAGGSIMISGGKVIAKADEFGISCSGEMTINNSNVEAEGGTWYGISSKKITIDNSQVTAKGISGSSAAGISAYGDNEGEGLVIINSGNVTAYGNNVGINAKKEVMIKGGTVNAEGTGANNSYGIYANNDITIEGGTVNARGNADSGIRSNVNNIIISGGKVTARGVKGGLSGTVKNSMAGTGWTDTDGKTGRTKININTDLGQTLTFKRVEFPENVVPPAPNPPAPSVVPAAPVEIQDLPAVKISKPAKGKKAVTVKWKKISKKKLKKSKKRIDGIEIQVSGPGVDKVVTAGKKKTSKKIKGLLPKQKYICRVRAYNYTDGVKHVSAWSKWKTAKTKK